VPAGPVVSMAALAMVAWLFSNSSWNEARLVAAAAAVGLPFYFFRSVRSDVPASI
jgi:hypothetical protein